MNNLADLLINTGASARWTDAHPGWEVSQHFVAGCGKPLKRLRRLGTSTHRAKAPVLMRVCGHVRCECELGTALLLAITVNSLAATHYVDIGSTNATPPYTSTNSPAPVVIGGQNTVTNPITGPQQFFRLIH